MATRVSVLSSVRPPARAIWKSNAALAKPGSSKSKPKRPIKESELPLLPIAALARLTLRGLITHWRAKRVPDRREYLLEHAKDDWRGVEQAMAVPMGDVVSQMG